MMNDILKEKYLQLKIKSKQNYLRIKVTRTNEFLDKVAGYLATDIDIIELDGKEVSDKLFLDIAKKVKLLCAQFEKTLIISNRADITFLSEADGICLTEDAMNIDEIKEILAPNTIIGTFNFECPNIDYAIYNFDKKLPDLTKFIAKECKANNTSWQLFYKSPIC